MKRFRISLRIGAAPTALAGGPVNVTLGAAAATAGADASGNPLLFAPNPVQLGSSISLWDTSAYPNQLMEPAINCNLTHRVNVPQDLTMEQLRDSGWEGEASREMRGPARKRRPLSCYGRILP